MQAVLKVLLPNPLIFFLTALSPIAVLDALENGFSADGEVIEVLRILTELIDGSYASPLSFHFTRYHISQKHAVAPSAPSSPSS